MEEFKKDNRNQRFTRVNFKKRDNKRENRIFENTCIVRIDQSFLAIFGDKYANEKHLNKVDKLRLIKEYKNMPKRMRKLNLEYPPLIAMEV